MSRDRIESWRADDGADRHRAKDRLPRLAMDGKTLLDAVQDGCFVAKERSIVKKKTTLTTDELTRYVGMAIKNQSAADRYWARCLGRDAAMDDETVEKLKSFLQSKLHPSDHAAACALMDGGAAAQETELPENAAGKALPKKTPAEDARMQADFFQRFPGMAAIKIDNSGIQPQRRPANPRVAMDAADAASFFEMFPDAARIKVL